MQQWQAKRAKRPDRGNRSHGLGSNKRNVRASSAKDFSVCKVLPVAWHRSLFFDMYLLLASEGLLISVSKEPIS